MVGRVVFRGDGTFTFTSTTTGALGADDTVYRETQTVKGSYEVSGDQLTASGSDGIALVRVADGARVSTDVLHSDPGLPPSWQTPTGQDPDGSSTTFSCDTTTMVLTTDKVYGVSGQQARSDFTREQ